MYNFDVSKLISYFTRENITLAIAIFGALGTIFTWISSFLRNRKRLNFKIHKLYIAGNILSCFISFENKSHLPISINGISVVFDKQYYPCNNTSQLLFKSTNKSNGKITAEKSVYTTQLPVNLSALSGSSGYFSFAVSQDVLENLSTLLTVQVSTNRGLPIEKKLAFQRLHNPADMF